jgi:glycine/D-amino acid oxidase-like deaminating enzyme
MTETFDVVVCGAGILGAATAYNLRRSGAKVLLLEKAQPAAGGTGKSAAIVRQHYSNPVLIRMARDSVEMFAAMPDELGRSGGYEACGWCFLIAPDMLAGAKKNLALQAELGVESRLLTTEETRELVPDLNSEGVAAVAYEPRGGYADPVQATEAYVAAYQTKSGDFRPKTKVRSLIRDGNAVTGVVTDGGAIHAGTVVNACGPWSKALAETAALDLPLTVYREQDTIWQARPERPIPTVSISNGADAIYIRPTGEGRFVIGRGFPKDYEETDPDGYNEEADGWFVSDVQERAERRLPPLAGMSLVAAYAALYDVTPDWYPILGPRKGLFGYVDACGGSGHGFKIAPAMGRALAEAILSGAPGADIHALGHDRFAEGRAFTQAYGGNRG